MSRLLTTTELARALALAPSTIRHYRSDGRLTPAALTPGGHARWDLAAARAELGYDTAPEGEVTGLVTESFAPAGETVIRADAPTGPLPMEMIALGVREVAEPDAGDAAHHRWGGALLRRQPELAA